ncbi:stage VI sporulation protein D [Niallia alba]|uniref:Stage VI sporulation protein D n=1 Tax=Niallia alba TaxID=2729105 RepID=A0A7Y0KAK0_9BACI|nr:stage VI sporulation protein D [Niallia alba]NMO78682.1 stage VI sporulation protein D [Niallia alba]
MSQENSSILRFSLEESVWFQKGQEVADLLSISLDPNITIQENDQYIIIQGSLELSGEYKRYNEGEQEEEEAFKAPKLIHSVMEREEGVCEFLHHFPVDITIPLTRVTSINDVEIEIDTFDYVFPERSCLNLTADLTISGLASEEEEVEEDVAAEEVEEELELVWRSPVAEEAEADSLEEPVEIAVSPFQNVSPLLEEQRAEKEAEDDLYTPFELEVRKTPEEDDEWSTNENANVPYFSEISREEELTSIEPALKEESTSTAPEMKISLCRSEESVYSAEEVFQKPQQESSSLAKQEKVALEEELELSSSPEISREEELTSIEPALKEESTSTAPEMKISLCRSEESVYSAEEVFQKPQQESSSLAKQEKVALEEELELSSSPEISREEELTSIEPALKEESTSTAPEMKISLCRSEESVYSAEEVFQKPQQESSSLAKQEEVALEEELESSSSPNEEPKKKKGLFSKKKSLTFTEFFARKEEEKHTKVKVCIVQQGDTLEKLSNRYNVNIHALLKENRMEANQDVYEGQVLYIPGDFVEK